MHKTKLFMNLVQKKNDQDHRWITETVSLKCLAFSFIETDRILYV